MTLSYNDLSRDRTLVCLFGASKNEGESTFTSLTSYYQQICNIFFHLSIFAMSPRSIIGIVMFSLGLYCSPFAPKMTKIILVKNSGKCKQEIQEKSNFPEFLVLSFSDFFFFFYKIFYHEYFVILGSRRGHCNFDSRLRDIAKD